jgi:orotidine-5'-phosphate decarboxylase
MEDEMTESFGDRVARAVHAHGPLCAGIDPSAELLRQWGLSDDAAGLRAFCAGCVEGFAGTVGVIKPQVAFFERHGSAGLAELERLISAASGAGLLVIADAKLAADAVTLHPYLGLGALAPCIELAAKTGRGVLVVTRSSNPEGRALQEATTVGGASVEETLLAEIAAWNAADGIPPGTVGAVIGATLAPSAFPLSQLGGVILAPGLGAQGAGPAEVNERFAGCLPGTVLPNSSRGLLTSGPDPKKLRQTAAAMQEQLAPLRG